MNASLQDIVFAFLQTYYQRMSKDPSKVSALYSLTAELTHINYQVEFDLGGETLPTIKLTGKENISKFFTRNNKKVSDLKVLIESCDFQTTGANHSSVLILTTGEMFWTGTPTYKFVQSIILTPNPSKNDSFDITNDVVRFIADNLSPYALETIETIETTDKKEIEPGEKASAAENSRMHMRTEETSKDDQSRDSTKAETGELIRDDGSDTKKPISIKEEVKSNKEDRKKVNKVEDITKVKPGVQSCESAEEQNMKKENESTDSVKKKSNPDTHQTMETPTIAASPVPPVRMSWASKLAANVATSKVNPSVESTAENIKSESQVFKKPSEIKLEDLASRKENPGNKTMKKKTPMFSTINKDGFYPIYIKRTMGLTEDKLKSALESEFGSVMRITISDNFAVVDFETQKSQIEALEKKQLTVGENEIFFSRKTVKKPSSSPPVGSSMSLRSHKKHTSYNNGSSKRKD
ncbi:hypothetical protein HG535_0F00190 [Zygotorulaspora mrakii]|uniref:NTF2 domain-containing protein n=1 Tax=Zygotorulaspora mrakii TaxID=42260 RepID=A0A7H9B6B1_ZYGMR|nr:uncharacterized protein HG535_0F00190 [Zygotorulaspora mrakii]QLG73509.1 hypothetical protein HG535_0F00190 [Zygotorulaspora mrakii]